SSRRRHTRFSRDWSSDVCSSDLSPASYPSSPRSGVLEQTWPVRPALHCRFASFLTSLCIRCGAPSSGLLSPSGWAGALFLSLPYLVTLYRRHHPFICPPLFRTDRRYSFTETHQNPLPDSHPGTKNTSQFNSPLASNRHNQSVRELAPALRCCRCLAGISRVWACPIRCPDFTE